MVVESWPSAALVVTEPDFLLEVLVIALDAPAHLGDIDQAPEFNLLIEGCEPIFCGLFGIRRPFDQQDCAESQQGGYSMPDVVASQMVTSHG